MDISGFLIDLDGVVYVGDTLVPGALEALSALKRKGIPFTFVSNTTRRSRSSVVSRLRAMGLPVEESLVFTPAVAAAKWLFEEKMTSCMVLSTQDMVRDLVEGGIRVGSEKPDAVIIGDAGDTISYDLLNRAFRAILDGAVLVALEKDRYWRGEPGLMLSAGPFVKALEYATEKEAILVGKPAEPFFLQALGSLGLSPAGAAMVGDDVVTDTGGAQSVGMKGILVRTGKYSEEMLSRALRKPDMVIDSIGGLPGLLPAP